MSFTIQKNLTKINFTDRNDISRIKYIVIHYFGSLGSAKSVSNYFASDYRGASAHYALDDDEIIWQCVEDEDIAWHCGTSGTTITRAAVTAIASGLRFVLISEYSYNVCV
jgi:N-acetyl-anhydromuramyl-L-alanine amidase AmpD